MITAYNVKDLRVTPGDSAYLIYDDQTAILYDSGFAFTGEKLSLRIKEVLGERKLDYIFLTHSHYDHCLGSAYVLERYPDAKVVAGKHTQEVFLRPHAISKMQELDNAHAKHFGITDYEFKGQGLRVDKVVKEGDKITVGSFDFTVLELPGHTKCSIGFYENNSKILLSNETLGIYHGTGILPVALTGFNDAISSIKKLKALKLKGVLIPHLGIIGEEATKHYLSIVEGEFLRAKELILTHLKNGTDREEIVEDFQNTFIQGAIKDIYPPDAAYLNSLLMIKLIEKEFLS
ncbi:MAG: MBL fold metallo-hydrolase [Clostridia bacterium]|nr:MBL fold metallo-hydrolase [Clostridia bacterium]